MNVMLAENFLELDWNFFFRMQFKKNKRYKSMKQKNDYKFLEEYLKQFYPN